MIEISDILWSSFESYDLICSESNSNSSVKKYKIIFSDYDKNFDFNNLKFFMNNKSAIKNLRMYMSISENKYTVMASIGLKWLIRVFNNYESAVCLLDEIEKWTKIGQLDKRDKLKSKLYLKVDETPTLTTESGFNLFYDYTPEVVVDL